MPTGVGIQNRVFYHGKDEDFIVLVAGEKQLEDWKKSENTMALVDVVEHFTIYVTHRQGAQGKLDKASKSSLENEFGSSVVDDAIIRVLKAGEFQHAKSGPKDMRKNEFKANNNSGY